MRTHEDQGPVRVPVGYTVAGWRVTEPLGSGGWGSVYAAEAVRAVDGADTPAASPREVALKFLPAALAPGQRGALLRDVANREREFSLLADHPCLIRTYDVQTARDPERPELDGALVLVMERASGNLKQLLRQDTDTRAPSSGTRTGTGSPDGHSHQPSRLPRPRRRRAPFQNAPEWQRQILVEVACALAHMHQRGWVHGDLKPGNVLLMADGSARLADFGVTARIEGTHAYVPRLGSSDYLPPEWWSERVGERGIPLRTSADVWAFGVLAHQALCGGLHPFPGATQQARALATQSYANGVTRLHLDEGLDEEWRRLIADCLAPDQRDRIQDGRALVDRLSRLGAPGLRGIAGASRTRTRVLASALAVLLAAVCAGLELWLTAPSSSADRSNPASASASTIHGFLRPNAAVPSQYRGLITDAAMSCSSDNVTPALVAGILKGESDFNPRYSNPQTQSYGIAGWTPSVFDSWAGNAGGSSSKQQSYMNPSDAIPAVGHFLCYLDSQFTKAGLTGDRTALLAAGYQSSDRTVITHRGVPPQVVTFATEVLHYTREYES